jgi:hypothetical protein
MVSVGPGRMTALGPDHRRVVPFPRIVDQAVRRRLGHAHEPDGDTIPGLAEDLVVRGRRDEERER